MKKYTAEELRDLPDEAIAAAEERGRRRGLEEAAKEIESAQPSGNVDLARFLVTRSLYARRVRRLALAPRG